MQGSDSDAQEYIDYQNHYLRDSSIKQETVLKNFPQPYEQIQIEIKTQKKCKKILDNVDITSLYEKKNKLLNFMETIGDYCYYPIRTDIMDHCQKLSKTLPQNISRQSILKLVKNRVQKMIKNRRIKKNWSEEDLKILIWVISKYCHYHGISNVRDGMTSADWTNIAELIPGVSGIACMFKWLSLKKNNLAENSWVQQQSLLLDQMVKIYGQDNWCRVSQQLFLKNTLTNKIYRCPKQCREHWNCYLNPDLKKGPWEPEEDYLLLSSVNQFGGVKKWAEIVKMFNGRTENALKNRYNLIIEKQKKVYINKKKQVEEIELIGNYLKKHQKQFQIDSEAQQYLYKRKKCINEDQSKRKPKKNKPKKQKIKDQSQIDEYLPEEMLRYNPERRNMRSKINMRSEEDQKSNDSDVQKKQQEQLEIEASIISLKKNSSIFYEDEQIDMQQEVKQEDGREILQNSTGSAHQIIQPQFPKYQLPLPQFSELQQQFSSENCNKIQIIPLNEQIMSQFKRFTHTLIPCRIRSTTDTEGYKIEKFDTSVPTDSKEQFSNN